MKRLICGWARGAPDILLLLLLLIILIGAGCGGDDGDPAERAVERSRAVVAGEWSYGQDTLPPEQGQREARIVERCRLTLETGETIDVDCGRIFIGLEADVESAWVDRLVDGLGAEVEERGSVPAWTTALDQPIPYLLLRVDTGREARALERALASQGVRFVDVREVARRRP